MNKSDEIGALVMTLSAAVEIVEAIHAGTWKTAWYAFAAAWFAWMVVYAKTKVLNG